MALITKEIVKSDWLNIAVSDTTKDNLIDRLIAHVGKEIATYTRQPIEQATETLYFTGTGQKAYPLYFTAACTIGNLFYRDEPIDSWVTVTDSTPVCFEDNGTQYLYYDSLTDPYYKATVTVGYTPVPEDVKLCAFEMVKELYNNTPFAAQGDRFGVSAINESDAGISWSKAIKAMRPQMETRLQKYRRYFL